MKKFTIISIFHADKTDEMQGAVLEGAIALVFLFGYGLIGSFFNWFI